MTNIGAALTVSLLLGFVVSACMGTQPTPTEAVEVLYFYFVPEGCTNCKDMALEIQRFYEEYGVEVNGVALYSTESMVEGFKSSTGLTIPIVPDPGLEVSTSHHPVIVLYDKQTKEHSVAAVGAISYQDLVSQYEDFAQNKPIAQLSGPT